MLPALAAVVLLVSVIFIKLGKVKLHRATMVLAMILSILFLLSYVAYHMTNDPTRSDYYKYNRTDKTSAEDSSVP